ncbi:MAG: hypothetical protein GWN16_11185 [Calditrichae bacterium]|nr:hypothetical protein [Calditrichia bacterium]NIW79978.1 hypothetical protein [Calditrichia bacterium]
MIPIQEAQQIVKDNLPQRQVEQIALADALGRLLTEDIYAAEPSPRYSNSAMDGFAVRWEDVQSATESNPVRLKIVGESRAGVPFTHRLQSGQAIRINTGAMICDGADTVIPIEDSEDNENTLRIKTVKKSQQHLRFEGEEFGKGALLLKQGTILNPARLALLASQGIASVRTYRKPGISVIVTGTELVRFYEPAKPWQIRDSNGLMLSASVQQSKGNILLSVQVGDDYEKTVSAINTALGDSQIILFSGGISVGEHDLVKNAAEECGFETLFWRVSQKPGKPLFFARKGETLFFGLPGNPVSAYVCYRFYVHPVIRYLTGEKFEHPTLQGKLAKSVRNDSERTNLLRVAIEPNGHQRPAIHPLSKQGSHMISSISDAHGFLIVEPGNEFKEGELVEVIIFAD